MSLYQSHDSFAKRLLAAYLEDFGSPQISYEVRDPPRFVDVYFEPDLTKKPFSLGLLGRMADRPCLLEPFRNPISIKDVEGCLAKLLTVSLNQQTSTPPTLWILTPTASERVLNYFPVYGDLEWGQGVYRVMQGSYIVVIHQLPKTRDTLRLRLLGRERVQSEAIQEVIELPLVDPLREMVLRLARDWRIMKDREGQTLNEEERELLMQLSPAYLKWEEETRNQGIQIGKQEGILDAAVRLVKAGIPLSQVAKILELDPAQVQQALKQGSC
jgi:hypothetical protein